MFPLQDISSSFVLQLLDGILLDALHVLIRAKVSGGKKCSDQAKYLDQAEERIASMLPEEARASLAKWTDEFALTPFVSSANGVDCEELKNEFLKSFRDRFSQYAIPANLADQAWQIIIEHGLNYLRDKEPEKYNLYSLGKNVQEALVKINWVYGKLSENERRLSTPEQMDMYLCENTVIPGTNSPLRLSLFDIDDAKCERQIADEICTGVVSISYFDRDEACLRVVSFLRRKFPDKTILVIKNRPTWNRAIEEETNGILICDFLHESPLPTSDKNICIFLKGDGQLNGFGTTVELPKRTISQLCEALEKLKIPDDDISSFIHETGGFFSFMLYKSWRGEYPLYRGLEHHAPIIKFALLCPYIPDDESFLKQASSFAGMPVKSFKRELNLLCSGPTPVFEKISYFGRGRYRVASKQALWCSFSKLVDSDDLRYFFRWQLSWIKYGFRDREMLSESWESITFACVKVNKDYQNIVDSSARKIFNQLISKELVYYSHPFLWNLACLAPESVLRCFRENKEQLSTFFDGASDNYLEHYNVHASIANALLRIITLESLGGSYQKQAYKLLAYFAEKENLKSNVGPSALEAYASLYVPWYNRSGLAVQTKISLALQLNEDFPETTKKAIKKGLITQTAFGSHSAASYRPEVMESVTKGEFLEYREALFRILLEGSTIHEKIELLEQANTIQIPYEYVNNLPLEIESYLSSCADDEKETIVSKLRSFVFKMRFYEREWGKGNPQFIQSIVEIIKSTQFSDSRYELLYIFRAHTLSETVLNPIPYSGKHDNANETLGRENAESTLIRMLDQGLRPDDIFSFLKANGITSRGRSTSFVVDIFETFKDDWYDALEKNGFYQEAYSYGARFFSTQEESLHWLSRAKSAEVRAKIYANFEVDKSLLNALSNEDENVRREYWNWTSKWPKDPDLRNKALGEAIAHGDSGHVLLNLMDNLNMFSADSIVNAITLLFEKSDENTRQDEYSFATCLKYLEGKIDGDLDLIQKIIPIEIKCARHAYDSSLYFAPIYWSTNPAQFAVQAKNALFNSSKSDEEEGLYHVLWIAQISFCPAVQNGVLDGEKFHVWVENFWEALQDDEGQYVYYTLLPRMLLSAPKDDPQIPLATAAALFLESCSDSHLNNEFVIAMINRYNVHTVDDGISLLMTANNYLHDATLLEERFPNVASLYREAAKDFELRAKEERERGRHR